MESVDITVVICTYNRAEQLNNALNDIMSQVSPGASFEILVVDDASTDSTNEVIAKAQAHSPVDVRSIKSDGSTLGAARNRGIDAARGDWIAFFDDDQRAESGWLWELWSTAQATGAEFVGGPIALRLPPRERVGPATRAILGEYPPARVRTLTPLPPGGNRLISREVFKQVGVHDESITTGGEDRDLLWRAQQNNVRFGWAAHASVSHVIEPGRLEAAALRSYCQMAGAGQATVTARKVGNAQLLLHSGLRILKGWIANGIVWAWALATRSQVLATDCQSRFWMAKGYIAEVPALLNSRERATSSFRNLRA